MLHATKYIRTLPAKNMSNKEETMLHTTKFHCDNCGQDKEYTGIGTGYERNDADQKICYECCAEGDRAYMRQHGKITLYLDIGKRKVTNWPGTLEFEVRRINKGRHNIARVRYDFWFAFENRWWHGVQYGNNTQLAHCKRTKDAVSS